MAEGHEEQPVDGFITAPMLPTRVGVHTFGDVVRHIPPLHW